MTAVGTGDDARGKASCRTESTAREPHLRAPLGESFGEVHGLGNTFIEGPGSYDGGRWVVVIRGEHVSTHRTRKDARDYMRARKDWCPAAPGPRCMERPWS